MNSKLSVIGLIAITLFAAGAGPAPTTHPSSLAHAEDQPKVIKLKLHPVAATEPALRYALLPNVVDQTPGNAAVLYLKAAICGPDIRDDSENTLAKYASETPLAQIPIDKASKLLEDRQVRLHLVEKAARCENVDWGSLDVRKEGIAAMLPHLNTQRQVSHEISLQARLYLAQKNWREACHWLQTGFSLSRQLGDRAQLVPGLVSAGIEDRMSSTVEDWVTQENAPNLYWALTDLPAPFIDLHTISQWEQSLAYFNCPDLIHDESMPSPEQARRLIWEIFAQYSQTSDPSLKLRVGVAHLVAAIYPSAKKYLLSAGTPKEQLDTLSPDQVVSCYFSRQFRSVSDDMWKGWGLPYWQAEPILKRYSHLDVRQEMINPILVILPSVRNARLMFALADRHIAILRTIEALRDYAAKHGGHPPRSLDDLVDTPAPIDPFTGKVFGYHADGDTAVLDAPVPLSPERGWRYELTFER